MSKVAIMGFGNPVRSDDAVGCYVVEQLQNRFSDREEVSLFDMGTASFEILFKLKGHDRIILVDGTINSDEEIGTLFKLPASQVERAPIDDPMVFLHGLKWDQALSYARKIMGDEYPENIDVYLVAIENTKLEVGMSDVVKAAGDRVIELIEEELSTEAA